MKKLNKYSLSAFFVKLSLFLIMMYSMICCVYISGIESNDVISSTYAVSVAELLIENILCAFTLTVAFGVLILYNLKISKSK